MKRDWQRNKLANQIGEKVSTRYVGHLVTDHGKKFCFVNSSRKKRQAKRSADAKRQSCTAHALLTDTRYGHISESKQFATTLVPLLRYSGARPARVADLAQAFFSPPEPSQSDSLAGR